MNPHRAVNPRRAITAIALAILLAGAAAGIWRSVHPDRPTDPAHRLAAELRCPACQGESVADSRSPIAAAMRDAIGAQLARGRTPDEVRAYLVERYGPDVLAEPPALGPGLLLWAVPVIALLAGLVPALRATRRRRQPTRPNPALHARARPGPIEHSAARSGPIEHSVARSGPIERGPAGRTAVRRVPGAHGWNLSAIGIVALVGLMALAAPRPSDPDPTAPPPDSAGPVDPVRGQLTLARSMEDQGRYAEAAEIYRTVLRQQPADEIRLRLAFTLIRAGQAGEAEQLAAQVLAGQPDAPDALLMLGLAQRQTDPGTADATLRRFLDRAPQHPAAPEIRRLLDGR